MAAIKYKINLDLNFWLFNLIRYAKQQIDTHVLVNFF